MTKRLRIYFPFALNELKRQMAYRGAFYLFIFINMFGAFISYFLWMAIYASADSPTLAGITRNEMVVYVFMSYITSQIVTVSMSDWVSDDVVKGSVAMNLIKPIDYRASLVSRAFGGMIYRFVVPAVFIWIGLEIYKVVVLGMAYTGIATVILYLISCIMSFMIYVLFDFCFGMIAFFTSYIFGMLLVKDALLSFLTGQLIPLSFFPEVIRNIFDFLPFSSMVYTPVMIYLGKYSGNELVFMLFRQAVWVVILYMLGSLVWKRVTKRLVVLGG